MAVLGAVNAVNRYQTNEADMVALIGLRKVNTGDTLDVSTVTTPPFQVIQRAVILGVSSFVEIAASFAGTVVTMPAGLANDSGYLTIWGC
jgi:hypothetical protein